MDRRRFSSAAVASLFLSTGWLLPVSVADDYLADECTKGIDIPTVDDYSDWPDLFRLTDPYPTDPTASNRDEDAGPVDPSVLLSAGVVYKHFDPAGFDYPNRTKQIPWSPPVNGTNDEDLQVFREEQDYQYADIVVVSGYAEKFYIEHLHAAGAEVRYVLDGTGYFDIRDVNDEWVRMHARAGDFVEFPSGIEHRFAVDDKLYIQAMRLYPGDGEPDWSSVSRSEVHGNNTSRNEYVDKYLCGVDPDLEDHHDDPDGHHDDPDHHDDSDGHHDDPDDHSDPDDTTSASVSKKTKKNNKKSKSKKSKSTPAPTLYLPPKCEDIGDPVYSGAVPQIFPSEFLRNYTASFPAALEGFEVSDAGAELGLQSFVSCFPNTAFPEAAMWCTTKGQQKLRITIHGTCLHDITDDYYYMKVVLSSVSFASNPTGVCRLLRRSRKAPGTWNEYETPDMKAAGGAVEWAYDDEHVGTRLKFSLCPDPGDEDKVEIVAASFD